MKLYYAPAACSLSSHIILHEIGKKFDLVKVDLGTKKTEGGKDFTKINAKGYVPVLEIKKDEVLTECAVIAQYLADKAKTAKLLAKAGTMARYRTIEWLNFCASEIHKSMGALFNKALTGEARTLTEERVTKRLDYLDKHLAKNNYMMGRSYTVADAYFFTCLNWGQWVNIDLARWKNIAAYMARIAKRPAVQAAMKAEGLLAA